MRHRIHGAALATGLAAALIVLSDVEAAQEDSIVAQTTRQLAELCVMPRTDPTHIQAVHFCHGFMAAGLSRHRATQRQGSGPANCGLPPNRQEAVDRFVHWTRANPQLASEDPAAGLSRFLETTYPCAGRAP